MTTRIMTLLMLPLVLGSLAGCSRDPQAGMPPPHFGNAVNQNIQAQLVNPDAPESDEAPYYNGERAAMAQRRYVGDRSEAANASVTSSIGGD